MFGSYRRFSSLLLVIFTPCLIAAALPESANGTIISISATGTAPQETRVVAVQAGVTTFATTAGRAWQDNAAAISKLKARLAESGVSAEDVRTTNIQLSASTRNKPFKEGYKDVQGFQVRHDLTVGFRDIGKAGPILDALVDAGANEISGPRFSWQAGKQATEIARANAIRAAGQRAQAYASALGLKIKRVVSMRDGDGYASQYAAGGLVVTGSRISTQISPGEDTVSVSIQADYELTL